MKVIFLDIDGVLNSSETMKEGVYLDNKKVLLLNEVITETDAKVVISSSWRIGQTVKEIKTFLKLAGLRRHPNIIGFTPNLKTGFRGDEVESWLQKHKEVTQYVIVDDGSDFLDHQKDYLVQTEWDVGLNWFFADQMRDILR
jgi:hypothetical protein